MNPIEVYIKNGYEVMNALIENADITTEEYPTVNIQLKLPCGGVIFGGYAFAKRVVGDFNLDGWEKLCKLISEGKFVAEGRWDKMQEG